MAKHAYKYRFYPTPDQKELFAKTFGCVRVAYNVVLRWRLDRYLKDAEKTNYSQASAYLTKIKKLPEFVWLNEVSSVPLQQSLRHQQKAFQNFFAGRSRYPKFKSKKTNTQTAEYSRSGFTQQDEGFYIAKCKTPLNIRWSRKLPAKPSTVTISKDASGRYFISCLCEFTPEVLPITTKKIGIDVGITDLFVDSNGGKTRNPRYTKKYEIKLTKAQKRLAKKKLGSKNQTKARIKVARIHAKISDCRIDNLHKLSRKLINENQVICVEDLVVKNMIKNPKLSKHIADAGWGEFIRQLEYKSTWAGREFVKIDRFFPSSKRCFDCGFVCETLPLVVRSWVCPECGSTHDRDLNAAKNILAVGMSILADGQSVSAFGENVSSDNISMLSPCSL